MSRYLGIYPENVRHGPVGARIGTFNRNQQQTNKIYWSNNKEKKLHSKDFSHIKPNSYLLEIESFISNIKNNNKISPSAEDGLEIMKMIEFIYSK